MNLRERLRVTAQALAAARAAKKAGKSDEEARLDAIEETRAAFPEVDWGVFLNFIIQIIEIFLSGWKPTAVILFLMIVLSGPVQAQCANGQCQRPLVVPSAAACTADSCPAGGCAVAGACGTGNCSCAPSAAPRVIRSTYAPMPPRWRPIRRFFARGR